MVRGKVLALVGLCCASACDELTGMRVEDRPGTLQVVLPMRCTDQLERTTEGMWVCRTKDEGVVSSHGDDGAARLPGTFFDTSGGSVWLIGTAGLTRYMENPTRRLLEPAPNAHHELPAGPKIASGLPLLLAHEEDVIVGMSDIKVVAAEGDELVVRTATASSFFTASSSDPSVTAFVEFSDLIWALGSRGGDPTLCPFVYTADRGIVGTMDCARMRARFVGTSSGGFWFAPEITSRVHFYLPSGGTIEHVDGLELPALHWVQGPVPWTTHPEPSKLIVPRVMARSLTIDRYESSAGHVWAGASEQWVWEVPEGEGQSTRVYAR